MTVLFSAFFRNGFLNGRDCDVYGKVYACFISADQNWGDASYLQLLTGFYGTIITVLIAVLTIVAALGAYTLRVSSRNQIEQELPVHVSDFFEMDRGVKKIKALADDAVDRALNARLQNLERPQTGALAEDLQYIEQQLDALTIQIEKLSEQRHSLGEVINDEED